MIIGAGVCLLAGLSGSNTVIYYASSVLKEAGVDDQGLLTLVVGYPTSSAGSSRCCARTSTAGGRCCSGRSGAWPCASPRFQPPLSPRLVTP